jgi:integrase
MSIQFFRFIRKLCLIIIRPSFKKQKTISVNVLLPVVPFSSRHVGVSILHKPHVACIDANWTYIEFRQCRLMSRAVVQNNTAVFTVCRGRGLRQAPGEVNEWNIHIHKLTPSGELRGHASRNNNQMHPFPMMSPHQFFESAVPVRTTVLAFSLRRVCPSRRKGKIYRLLRAGWANSPSSSTKALVKAVAELGIELSAMDNSNMTRKNSQSATTTFGEVARKWLDDRFPGPSKQRREAEHMLFVHTKELVERPIIQIRAKQIAEVLRPLSKEMPDRFRRVLIRIESVFDYAKSKDLFTAENPARWKEKQKNFYPTFKNKRGHFSAMPYEDVPEFVQALRQYQNNSVAAVALEICVLTAARSGEILGMRRSEVDLENRIWTIPAARMKGGRGHIVPLSDRAIELLKRRYEQRGISDYVFTAHRRPTPMDEKSMRQILHKMNKSVTVHGFRSSFRDWCGDETNFAREAVEACLAHVVGNASETAYRRRTALEKRREIMKAWAEYCETLCKAAMRAPE